MSLRSACFNNEALFWCEANLLVLGLFSRARLSGFPNYQASGYGNFAAHADEY
jgi:hypothetical protein